MGKKGKKKKEGSRGSGEKKMTFAEALLAYQIQMRESAIDELRAEVKQTEEKNSRYKDRNERLKQEQTGHIKTLLSEAKVQEKELAKKEVINREQVDLAIKEKWEYCQEKERLIEEIRCRINLLKRTITEKQSERDYWAKYKNVGSKDHAKQIYLLGAEINHNKQNFSEINEYFRKNLETAKMEIGKETEKLMEERKKLATLSAVKEIDTESHKEIHENDWLNKEVSLYRKEVYDLKQAVESLEQENLEILNQLFDCRLKDLKIPRNVFLTQVLGLEVPNDDSLTDVANEVGTESNSATLAAVEEEVISVDALLEDEDLSHLLHEGEKDFEQYLQPGPLELKLLRIEGQRMPVHQVGEETKKHEILNYPCAQKNKCQLNPRMIRSALEDDYAKTLDA